MNTYLFTTTDAESLYFRLEKKLFRPESAFRQIVIVPHSLVRKTIYEKLLGDSVAMGFKVFELGPGVDYLLRMLRFEEKKGHSFPAPMIFALHLQALIKEFLERNDPLFTPVQEYLQSFPFSNSDEIRLQELAETLSLDFLHYGMYGGAGLKAWLEASSWQTQLFKKAFTFWDYPARAFEHLKLPSQDDMDVEIHLFGFSFLPKIYETLFHKLGMRFNVHHYYLTPTQEYFGQARSDKERLWLQSVQDHTLEEIALEDNPLIANFGKQTRRRFLHLVDSEVYREEFFYEEPRSQTLLSKLQHTVFTNDPIRSSELVESLDDSFEVHRSPSHKREIEALLQTLMRLTAHSSIEPCDIVVLAPDISVYFSYIKEVFELQSPFEIEVAGLEIQSQSAFLQAFSSIIACCESRWEKKDILDLLGYAVIRNQFDILPEDLEVISDWLDKAHVFWGYHLAHKKELVVGKGENLSSNISAEGSLSFGMSKLILAVAYDPCDEDLDESFYPIEGIEPDQMELFGKFLTFTKALWGQREAVVGKEKTLGEWIATIKSCLRSFFVKQDSQGDEGFSFFMQQLHALEQLSFKIPESQYTFFHLKRVFHKTFIKKSAVYSGKNKNVIHFASLASQQLFPAKVIVYLGLDESSFPKRQATYPLREIPYSNMDPYPQMIEEQRQMLLDGLLFAQQHLIFSYCFYDEKDGKQQDCSYLLKEFLEIIDKTFHLKQGCISKEIITTHRFLRFDREELASIRKYPYFSLRDYELAKAFYEKTSHKRRFIPEFYERKDKVAEEMQRRQPKLRLSHLQKFARNPLRYYMSDALGLRIESSFEDTSINKEFLLSSLEKTLFLKETLQDGSSRRWLDRKLSGRIPKGFLGKVAEQEYEKEKQQLLENCKALGLNIEEFFTIELSSLCESPYQLEPKHWVVPSLQVDVDGDVRQIQGNLELCHPQGLAFFSKHDFADLLRFWPIYLVYLNIISRDFSQTCGEKAFFIKSCAYKDLKIKRPDELLKKYLSYFEKSHRAPSPLLPAWGEALLLKSGKDKESAIKKSFLESMQQGYVDEYQAWCFQHLECFCSETIDNAWNETLAVAFSDFIKWSGKEVVDA